MFSRIGRQKNTRARADHLFSVPPLLPPPPPPQLRSITAFQAVALPHARTQLGTGFPTPVCEPRAAWLQKQTLQISQTGAKLVSPNPPNSPFYCTGQVVGLGLPPACPSVLVLPLLVTTQAPESLHGCRCAGVRVAGPNMPEATGPCVPLFPRQGSAQEGHRRMGRSAAKVRRRSADGAGLLVQRVWEIEGEPLRVQSRSPKRTRGRQRDASSWEGERTREDRLLVKRGGTSLMRLPRKVPARAMLGHTHGTTSVSLAHRLCSDQRYSSQSLQSPSADCQVQLRRVPL